MTTQLLAAPKLLSPDYLVPTFGLIGLMIILFAETGLLVGFFLPGDTLLFAGGLLLATKAWHAPLWLVLILLPIAAILGNIVGYWIGAKAGPAVFHRPNSRMFKPEYVDRSEAFFRRFGPATIVLARFVPVVRTVATVLAGVSRMRFDLYLLYSVLGGILWADGVFMAGFWLGHFKFVRDHVEPLIEPILIAVVVISILPALVHYLRGRRRPAR